MGFPGPVERVIEIFPDQPTETETTFDAGVPARLQNREEAISIILFSPNLQLIACMDNQNSGSNSSYSTSFTRGFSFTADQSFSISAQVGISIEVIFNASVTTTFALSFSEQWNESETKSMSFSCPSEELAFVYQGTLMARPLALNASDGSYSWAGDAIRTLTDVLITSRTPIGNAPSSMSVKIVDPEAES